MNRSVALFVALALLILFVTIVPGVLWRLFSGKELEVLP